MGAKDRAAPQHRPLEEMTMPQRHAAELCSLRDIMASKDTSLQVEDLAKDKPPQKEEKENDDANHSGAS